jgi:outer membrane biosynthesis protein TonB
MAYLSFVEKHPVGSVVKGVVDGYSANGVIVKIGDIRGYAPLRLLGNPAPRRPRDVFAMGQSVTLMIAGYTASRRSVDLGVVEVVSLVLKKTAKKDVGKKVPAKSVAKAAKKKNPLVKKDAATKDIAKKETMKKDAVKKDVAKKEPAKKMVAKKTTKTPVAKKATSKQMTGTTSAVKKSSTK